MFSARRTKNPSARADDVRSSMPIVSMVEWTARWLGDKSKPAAWQQLPRRCSDIDLPNGLVVFRRSINRFYPAGCISMRVCRIIGTKLHDSTIDNTIGHHQRSSSETSTSLQMLSGSVDLTSTMLLNVTKKGHVNSEGLLRNSQGE